MSFVCLFKDINTVSFEDVRKIRWTLDSAASQNGEVSSFSRSVRRPMRGILLKKETYASISVLGTPRPLRNSSLQPPFETTITTGSYSATQKGGHQYTTNFLLQSVTETRTEKVQYVSTFGSTYAFFYGEQPRIINCAAVLLNTPDFNWEKEWWFNYEKTLRGTSLTSMNSKAVLEFDGYTVVGYMTNCTTMKNAQDPNLVNINFSMFIESVEVDNGSIGSDAPYGEDRTTEGAYLGVGSVANRDDLRLLEESTTAAVRRANIQISELNKSATPGKLMGALSAIDNALSNFIRNARNALYGRNMVVSRSFVGERYATPLFPEGTGAGDLEGLGVSDFYGKSVLSFSDNPKPGSSSVTLRSNTDGFISKEYLMSEERKKPRRTWENYDEYVNAPPVGTWPDDVTDAIAREEFARQMANMPGGDLNSAAVAAFSAFGMTKEVSPYVAGVAGTDPRDSTVAVAAYNTAAGKQFGASVVRTLARTAFGVATFAVGTSIVNRRRDLQASITNPNNGGLDAETIASLNSEMAATSQTTEQQRLRDQARAEELRGNTGTHYNIGEAIMSVIL